MTTTPLRIERGARQLGVPRVVAFVVALAVLLAATLVPNVPTFNELRIGDVAPRTYRAPADLTFESAVLREQRADQAAADVPDRVSVDPNVRVSQVAAFDTLAGAVTAVRDDLSLNDPQRLEALANVPGQDLTSQKLLYLLSLDDAKWASAVDEGRELLGSTLLGPLAADGVETARLDLASRLEMEDQALRELVVDLVSPYVVANQLVDSEKTQADRDAARATIGPQRVSFTQDQVIVSDGQVINDAALEALAAAHLLDTRFSRHEMAALGAIALIVSALLGWYLLIFQPKAMVSLRRQVMLVFLLVVITAVTKLVFPLLLPDAERRGLEFALPVAAIPMLVAALLEVRLALFVAVLTAVVVSFGAAYAPASAHFPAGQPLDSMRMMLVYLVGGVVGVFSVYRAERFSRYLLAGVAVGGATWVMLAIFWLIDGSENLEQLAWISVASAICGLSAAVITLGSFVFLSTAFGITTRLQLMELAQLNAPLMRRLQDEAPGTFHHSIIVSNLGERAADLIGADSLLVRVGCYYHDIGKVAQPAFYIENQLSGENPHDHLDPYTSAKIIADHVRNGVELERRYGIPRVVQQFTQEHHGTRLVAYFYRTAAEEDPDLDPSPFQYPGPRPRTKETAIVMLADSVEATVRAARDRSRERIDEIVESIISERLSEGQLDDSDLTLREIRVIAESFKTTLRAVYHPRIEYPPPSNLERRANVVTAATTPEPAALPPAPIPIDERGRARR